MNSLISVIIPVYNVSKYIDTCLKSVISQDYSNMEIILINDGSTDDSWEKCLAWQAKDNRIVCVIQKNLGAGAARNKGISIANGEYITFIDSDDIVEQNYLSSLCHAIELQQADLAIAFRDIDIISNDIPDVVYGADAMHLLCMGKINTGVPAKLYKKELLTEILFLEGMVYEDILFTFEIVGKCKKIVFCKSPLYHYNKHFESVTHTYSVENFWDMVRAFDLVTNYLDNLCHINHSDRVIRKCYNWSLLECEFHKNYAKNINKQECDCIQNKLNVIWEDAVRDIKEIGKIKLSKKIRLKLFLVQYAPKLYYPMKVMWTKFAKKPY